MDVDGDGLSEAGRAGVGPRVRGARVLHHEEAGRDVTLVGQHAHAAAGRVVRDDLNKKALHVERTLRSQCS